MTFSQLNSTRQLTEAAVLLVLLPRNSGEGKLGPLTSTNAALNYLQQELGPAIRILRIDEASHPAVVRSFHATELPAFVLLREGIELWRHQGLPESDAIVPLLLNKINA